MFYDRCGNVASILELDERLAQEYKVFQHAPSVSSLPLISPKRRYAGMKCLHFIQRCDLIMSRQ
jgi:hypothetical protein